MTDAKDLVIRPARPADVPLIHALICELADFERLRDSVDAREMDAAVALFGPVPRVFCDIAEWMGVPAGFALWFYNYSTFRGRHGIYLEDLFVRPQYRGNGIGRELIVNLAHRCIDENLPRLQWQVLDWNKPSIEFYESLGAKVTPEWLGCRLEGEAIARVAAARMNKTEA